MRSAGCIINDFADRNVDPYVKRTKDRPLAARRIAPQEALVLFFALAGVALFLALQLDFNTLKLAFIGAALTVSYPFFKRFFPLPQFYLGLAFGWAVPMAYMAAAGSLPRVAWVLFVTAVLWACIYDTLYAMVDRDDDLKIGVKSSAILFADMDKLIVAIIAGDDAVLAVSRRQDDEVRQLVHRGRGRGRRVLSLPAVAHPGSRAGEVFSGVRQQPVCRAVGLHRDPARIRLRRLMQ